LELCKVESDLTYKATKSLLKLPKLAIYSPSCKQLSQMHAAHRRREMMLYYTNKVEQIAQDSSQYEVIMGDSEVVQEALMLKEEDLRALREKIRRAKVEGEKVRT